jgi:diaminopimelate epimerase
MRFTKMHGLGNDYVVVDGFQHRIAEPAELARSACDRRLGVGADGLLLVLPSKSSDFRMRMFNPDGSEAEMCGNGIRCFGKYVFEHGLTRKKRITVETIPGVMTLDLAVRGRRVDSVSVDMGPPRNVPPSFYRHAPGDRPLVPAKIRAGDRVFDASILSVGNPHCVIFVDDVDSFAIEKYGPLIERHPDFPSRVNVEFVQRTGPNRLKQRTWERGAKETHACGTGATALAASLFLTGRASGALTVDLLGGTLTLQMRGGRLIKTGPAVEVFEGELPDPKPARKARAVSTSR